MSHTRRIISVVMVLSIAAAWQSAAYGDRSVAEIRAAIEAGVQHLIGMQQADGSWKDPAQHGGSGYDVGRTALATLALQHSQSGKVNLAIHNGLTFITQQWPENKTYSAGCVQQALYKAGRDSQAYRRHLSMYGWMLAKSQKVFGPQAGCYSYGLYGFPKDFDSRKNYEPPASLLSGRGDNSNTQFGILGLYFSHKAGVQIPRIIWRRAQKYYIGAQHQDGGWDYQSSAYRVSVGQDPNQRTSSHNMTFAGAISLYICNEMLWERKGNDCKPIPESREVEKGLQWVEDNWRNGYAPYGWYALERLGIITGRSEFGGVDWYQAGATQLSGQVSSGGGGNMPNLAFGILFLSRGLEPIIFNKLKRGGDWEIFRYDIPHLTEYISDKMQKPSQWRIVTLRASVDYLLKVPTLVISGCEEVQFTDEEKQKLKAYVEGGGTILAEAACAGKKFDESFRALVAELWPDAAFQQLPKSHPVFNTPRPIKTTLPTVLAVGLRANQGRLSIFYFPYGNMARQWDRGGTKATMAFDVGTNLHFYIEKIAGRYTSRPAPTDTVDTTGGLITPPTTAPARPSVIDPVLRPDNPGVVEEEER